MQLLIKRFEELLPRPGTIPIGLLFGGRGDLLYVYPTAPQLNFCKGASVWLELRNLLHTISVKTNEDFHQQRDRLIQIATLDHAIVTV